VDEIIADEKKRFAQGYGQGVREAIAEVEACVGRRASKRS